MELVKAINYLFPDAVSRVDFSVRDDGEGPYIETWNLPDQQPDEAALTAASGAYCAEQQAVEYRALRAAEYPQIGDQLDALWKMITPPAGSEAEKMKADINAIKAKHPKPVAP